MKNGIMGSKLEVLPSNSPDLGLESDSDWAKLSNGAVYDAVKGCSTLILRWKPHVNMQGSCTNDPTTLFKF